MSTIRILARIAVAAMLLAACAAAQADNESKAGDGPKPPARARRVITNDDIPPSPQPDPAPANRKPASAQSLPGASHDGAAALSKVGLTNEDDDVRQAVEQIRKREIALQEKLHRLKDKLANEDDDFRRQMWADALENQKATLEQYRKVRERLEQEQHPDPGKPLAPAAPGS